MLIIRWMLTSRRAKRTPQLPRVPWLFAVLLPALATVGVGYSYAQAQDQNPHLARGQHALVISIDGMGASLYATPRPQLHIPNLQRLKQGGSFAEGVEGVYPTVTYPSHTTIVTGRLPAEHGIYTNLSSREPGKSALDWFWFASAIKVPTLWDEARRAHLSTATVSWPVTVGAAVDWNVPEIWDPQKGEVSDPLYVAKHMSPLLSVELFTALGPPQAGTDDDTNRTRLAVYLVTKHKPDLLLIHLAALDEAEHAHGPQSTEAARTLQRIDAHLGELLAALKEAGLAGSTDVFIVSDHGFLPIEQEIRPNILLVRTGLLTADGKGSVTGGKIATVSNGGSFFIYWPEGQNLRPEVDAALKPLRERGVLWGVLDKRALRDLGAEPAAQMALEAAEGSYFSSSASGEVIGKRKTSGGTHGFLPFRKGLESSFIAWGPRIKAGVDLHRIRMTAIAPTILRALGINDPDFGNEPPLRDIFKSRDQ